MTGWKVARVLGTALAATALGAGCDVSAVVGYNEDALGTLRCADNAPFAQCSELACVIRDLEPAQVGSTAIAVDDDSVYYLRDAGAIVKAPVVGGAVVELATSTDGAFHMAVDATHLYWSEHARRIWRVRKTGGAPEVVADIQGHPRVIALDTTHVYATLTDTNQLVMTPKEPGKSTFLADQSAPYWVVTDATHVYWINQGGAANTGELLRAPLGALARSERLLEGLDAPVTLALSPTHAYFVAGKQLLRVEKQGGVAQTLHDELDETKSMATYGDAVYLSGIAGLLRVTPSKSTLLDTRTTLGLAVGCSGLVTTGWLVPALLRYAP